MNLSSSGEKNIMNVKVKFDISFILFAWPLLCVSVAIALTDIKCDIWTCAPCFTHLTGFYL